MRIKKFVGSTLKEATAEMNRDMGPDAIVIGTRRFTKGGLFNFLSKEYIEITAAHDNQIDEYRTVKPEKTRAGSLYDNISKAGDHNDDNELTANLENLKRVAEQFSKRRTIHNTSSEKTGYVYPVKSNGNINLASEVETIKTTLSEITRQIKYSKLPALPDTLNAIFEQLVEQDVDQKLAADIVQGVYGKLSEGDHADKDIAVEHVLNELKEIIDGEEHRLRNTKRKSKIVALIGPTGVGKTTTIAKLASIEKLVNQKNVGLLSIDTYRIGAIEQLRTFAAIADIQMEVVYKSSEMQNALRKLRSKDVIFIDTVGRSQRVKKEMNELRKFVEAANPDEIHLVLNASTTVRTMSDIITRFRIMDPNRLVFSKLDEAVSFGPLLSVMHKHRIPLSYATTGQDVPDDIFAVDAEKFAAMIYTGVIPNA